MLTYPVRFAGLAWDDETLRECLVCSELTYSFPSGGRRLSLAEIQHQTNGQVT